MQLKPGTYLQNRKFKIIHTLGHGGFGITYLAEHTLLGENVAIKEFFTGVCSRNDSTGEVSVSAYNQDSFERGKEKFIKEARRLYRLSHPNIIKVTDVFEEHETAYYVMDYLPDGSVADMMRRSGGRLPESKVKVYLKEILSALEIVHHNGLLHLDLKPANLMMKGDSVVLIDFGASKQIETPQGQTSTSTSLAYTPGYASPELLSGELSKLGSWTDIYGLGATLYNMLTGKNPPSQLEILDDGFPEMPGITERLATVVEKMMMPQLKRRMKTVDDVKQFVNFGVNKDIDESEDENKTKRINEEPRYVDRVEESGNPTEIINPVPIKVGRINVKHEDVAGPKLKSFVNGDVQSFDVGGVSFDMVSVEGGRFTMGATSEQGDEADNDEKPTHQVTLNDYMIGQTEVTQKLWQAVMGSNPSSFKGDNLPVETVSWEDCQEFVKKLNELTQGSRPQGMVFRLPTEAEWEYAARGGNKSRGYKYSGSNAIDDVAWYRENSSLGFWKGRRTHAVATKLPNELGLYDMTGNVWEWCYDLYGGYSDGSQTNPKGPSTGSARVLRGGSWSYDARFCRVSNRGSSNPGYRYYDRGVRVCLGRGL